jgi:hypothetical protein
MALRDLLVAVEAAALAKASAQAAYDAARRVSAAERTVIAEKAANEAATFVAAADAALAATKVAAFGTVLEALFGARSAADAAELQLEYNLGWSYMPADAAIEAAIKNAREALGKAA